MQIETLQDLLTRAARLGARYMWSGRESQLAKVINDGVSQDIEDAVDAAVDGVKEAPSVVVATDSTSTGDIDALALPGSGAVVFTHATAPSIRGIAGGTEGRILTVVNGSVSNLTLVNLSGDAEAEDQIAVPGVSLDISDQVRAAANGILLPGAAAQLMYAAGKWRVLGGQFSLVP